MSPFFARRDVINFNFYNSYLDSHSSFLRRMEIYWSNLLNRLHTVSLEVGSVVWFGYQFTVLVGKRIKIIYYCGLTS